MAATNSSFQRRYPPEMRERAVRIVREAIAESGKRVGAVSRVARQLGIGPESLRNWVKQADIDNGKRPGLTTAEQLRIAELERDAHGRIIGEIQVEPVSDLLGAPANRPAPVLASPVTTSDPPWGVRYRGRHG